MPPDQIKGGLWRGFQVYPKRHVIVAFGNLAKIWSSKTWLQNPFLEFPAIRVAKVFDIFGTTVLNRTP